MNECTLLRLENLLNDLRFEIEKEGWKSGGIKISLEEALNILEEYVGGLAAELDGTDLEDDVNADN